VIAAGGPNRATSDRGSAPEAEDADSHRQRHAVDDDGDGADVDESSVPSKTPTAVAFWYRRDPSMHLAEIAAKMGRYERTVRRYWPPTAQQAINGHEARRLADGLRAPWITAFRAEADAVVVTVVADPAGRPYPAPLLTAGQRCLR
jgi:hypothetical protein